MKTSPSFRSFEHHEFHGADFGRVFHGEGFRAFAPSFFVSDASPVCYQTIAEPVALIEPRPVFARIGGGHADGIGLLALAFAGVCLLAVLMSRNTRKD